MASVEFSEETVLRAWNRAGGRCECRRRTHGHHYVRCNKELSFSNRGRFGRGKWEANHRTRVESGGTGAFSNCEIVCWDCHAATF